jgi:hypothetical protein
MPIALHVPFDPESGEEMLKMPTIIVVVILF